jgi:hypothetical protein
MCGRDGGSEKTDMRTRVIIGRKLYNKKIKTNE